MDQMKNHVIPKNNVRQSEAATQATTKSYVLDDYEKKIVSMWNTGFSAAQIALAVGKNRNMVIGKVWRMRQKGVVLHFHERPKSNKPNTVRVKRTERRKKSVLPLFDFKPPPKPVEAKPLNISFWQLKNNSCRYVTNEGRPENFLFCGAPKERGSYCEAHAKICFAPPKTPAPMQRSPIAQRRYYR